MEIEYKNDTASVIDSLYLRKSGNVRNVIYSGNSPLIGI